MNRQSKYHLIKEMFETPAVMRRFDPQRTVNWRKKIKKEQKLFITGEGSSRIFPAKNLMDHALKYRTDWQMFTHGARQAADYNLDDYVMLAASNSGKTREVIELYKDVRNCKFALTAANNSPLQGVSDDTIVLSCGPEQAVAASKSVVEQALVYQSLLNGPEWGNLSDAADAFEKILSAEIDPEIIVRMVHAKHIYFAGREDGVAEELTLKTNEIIRKKSAFLEGTYALHGIEEVINNKHLIVLIDPFYKEIEAYKYILQEKADIPIIAIAAFDTPFPTIKISQVEGFNNYLQLAAGWNLLATTGLEMNIDIDRPERARKVGNSI